MKTTIDICPKCGKQVYERDVHSHKGYGHIEPVEIEVEYDPSDTLATNVKHLAQNAKKHAKRKAADKAERERWAALTATEQRADDPERFEIQEATKDMNTGQAMDYILRRVWSADNLKDFAAKP